MDITPLQIAVFVFISVGVGTLAFGWGTPSDSARLRERMDRIAGRAEVDSAGDGGLDDQRRKRKVKETLRELRVREAGRARNRAKPTLIGRLRQAGLPWSRRTYVTVSVLVASATWVVALLLLQTGLLAALGFAIAAGLLIPHLYVSQKRAARLKKFGEDFPNAIDIIVRGVRSGLPLVDGLKTIAAEVEEPIKSEFALIVRDQTLGVPLDEAVQRLADRMPLQETSFFAIVIGIQSRTGGNLSEALSNLSKVVRGRKQIAAKIQAMSSEAKTSAMIIGCMPPLVMVLLYFVSPEYLALLFTTFAGNMVLAGSVLWMGIGIMVMRGMIRFDY